jgi:CubicO group peptidase (beta-lactamase class C family)
MDHRSGLLKDRETLIAQFEEELNHQTPIRPWSDLEETYDPQLLNTFNGSIIPSSLSTSGLILDDTIYLQPCYTRYGPFPYCGSMRHGSFSVTKSMGAAIAMLRLAEKYGEEVFEFKIVDYVEVTADHDGWEEVTFADALNMATGIGDDLPERVAPNVMLSDEEGDEQIFNGFMEAMSARDKADICFTADNYPWDPGEVGRYNSCHTFILSLAMNSFLQSVEGADADIWDMVLEEVYRPIGIYRAPIMRTVEPDGSRGIPQFWVGLYPTVDDVAKIAILLRNGGQHQGQQILHAGKLAEALRQTDVVGLPTGEFNDYGEGAYHMSFWSMPYRSAAGDLFQIPYMSGFGGNRVILNPNGIITFQFADAHIYGFESMVKVADGMDPFLAP